MTIIDTREISQAIERRSSELRDSQNEWVAVEEVVAAQIVPLVGLLGSSAVLNALEEAKSDPLIAAVLVACTGTGGDVQLTRPGKDILRITDIYGDDEILAAALAYLRKFPRETLHDGRWAWTALSNGWEQLKRADQLRLVIELIRLAPDDDASLEAIAVGPAREVFGEGDEGSRLLELARDDRKIARVVELM
jgi:hypothetical protein